MKSAALLRSLVTLGLWVMLLQAAHAGSILQVLEAEYNDPTTSNDDTFSQVQLRWPDGANVQFWYGKVAGSNTLLNTFATYVDDPNGLITAMARALERWDKKATYSSARRFSLMTSPLEASQGNMGLFLMPDGLTPYIPSSVQLDGFNFIEFAGTTTGGGGAAGTPPATTVISYFARDFDMPTLLKPNGGVPPEYILSSVGGNLVGSANANVAAVYIGLGNPFQGGGGGGGNAQSTGNAWLFIPVKKYNQGEIFDVDIAFNTSQIPSWPLGAPRWLLLFRPTSS